MRAYQFTVWQQWPSLTDVTQPDPGPGEVLVRVGGSGACHSDLHVMEFEGGLLPYELPFTLGHEVAGWVEAVGPGVTAFESGEPVAVYGPWGCGRCRRCRQGMENYCERAAELGAAGGGLGRDGGHAEYMLVPSARLLVPLGEVDPRQAAPLTDAGLTPYHAVKLSVPKLQAGSTAVAIGVGGLGHVGVQILKALTPARIIAVDLAEDKLRTALDVGADHAVVSDENAAEEVLGLTGGKGADAVIDFVGAQPTLDLAVGVVRTLGDLSIVGIGGGSLDVGFFTVPQEATVRTTYWGSITELMEVLALAERGALQVHTQQFPLDDVETAYRQLEAGRIDGRAVILPNG